jgi:hypothetical protein
MSSYLRWLSARLAEHVPLDRPFGVASRHVIGWAVGCHVDRVGLFVRSLRSVFDDAITLVVDPDPALGEMLDEAGIRAVVPPRVLGWRSDHALTRLATFQHLVRQVSDDAAVVLTDVEDVVFQGDPLSPCPTLIEAFQPSRDVSQASGLDLARALQTGTVVGPATDLAALCQSLLQRIEADPVTSGIADVRLAPTSYRFVEAGPSDGARLRTIDGVVVNPDGSVSPILHGYSRHPKLSDAVRRRWGEEAAHRRRRQGRRFLSALDTPSPGRRRVAPQPS